MPERFNEEKYVSDLTDNRIQNTARVAAMNVCHVIVATVGPFIIRTLMIYYLGDEFAGLNSLFISIISVLNMAELGLANVIIFFLYEPMAKGDNERTAQYLNVLRRIYRYIGLAVLGIGLIIMSFIPRLVKQAEVPAGVNPYFIFFIYLVSTAIQYFILPGVDALVNAAQRGYFISAMGISGNILAYVLQTIAIVVFRSFTLYFVAIFIQCIWVSLLRWHIKRRYFYNITPHGDIDDDAKKQLRKKVLALMGHQMNDKFISSIDNVVLSVFMGLTTVTIYGNYMYIVSAVSMFVVTVFGALTASLGNAFVTETAEDNFVRFRAVLWLNGISVSWAMCCMLCMYQPFMRLWMGDRILPMSTVVLFCLYFFVMQIRRAVVTFKDANGMWWEDRYKPYVSMVLNLVLDIILVQYIGINGALISSIICVMLIEIPWEGKVLYKRYFDRETREYLGSVRNYFVFGVIMSATTYGICSKIIVREGILTLVTRFFIVTVFFVIIIFAVFRDNADLKVWRDSVGILLGKNADSNRDKAIYKSDDV